MLTILRSSQLYSEGLNIIKLFCEILQLFLCIVVFPVFSGDNIVLLCVPLSTGLSQSSITFGSYYSVFAFHIIKSFFLFFKPVF
jgi:hypothetical protein